MYVRIEDHTPAIEARWNFNKDTTYAQIRDWAKKINKARM